MGCCESDGVGHVAHQAPVGGSADQELMQGGVPLDAGTDQTPRQGCAQDRDESSRRPHVADGTGSAWVIPITGLGHAERVQHARADALLEGAARRRCDDFAGEQVPDVGVGRPAAHGPFGRSVLRDDLAQERGVFWLVVATHPSDRQRIAEACGVGQEVTRGGVAVPVAATVARQVVVDGCVDVEDAVGMEAHGGRGGGDLRHREPGVLVLGAGDPTRVQVRVPDCAGVQETFGSGDREGHAGDLAARGDGPHDLACLVCVVGPRFDAGPFAVAVIGIHAMALSLVSGERDEVLVLTSRMSRWVRPMRCRATRATPAVSSTTATRAASFRPSPSTRAATTPSSLLVRLKTVWSNATARMLSRVPRRNTPIISRTSVETMSSVTSAVMRDPAEKLPMKCRGMCASANVTDGSAARTSTVQVAPIRRRNMRFTSLATPGRPSAVHVTHMAAGRSATKTSRTEAMRSVSRLCACSSQPLGITPWLAMIGTDITG